MKKAEFVDVKAISYGGGAGSSGTAGGGGKFSGTHATVSAAMCHFSNNKGMACRTLGKNLSFTSGSSNSHGIKGGCTGGPLGGRVGGPVGGA